MIRHGADVRRLAAFLLLSATLTALHAAVDVGVDTIPVPDGNVEGFRWVTPTAKCRNYGTDTAAFTAWMTLQDTSGMLGYLESLRVECLAPGTETTLAFPNWRVTMHHVLYWVATCSTFTAGDCNDANDIRRKPFSVSGHCM